MEKYPKAVVSVFPNFFCNNLNLFLSEKCHRQIVVAIWSAVQFSGSDDMKIAA